MTSPLSAYPRTADARKLASEIAQEPWPERPFTRTVVILALHDLADEVDRLHSAIREHERDTKKSTNERLWSALGGGE